MDELARALGVDPLEFRLKHLRTSGCAPCSTAAAQRFGLAEAVAAGPRLGIACGTEKGGYVATCARSSPGRANGVQGRAASSRRSSAARSSTPTA